jgi:branched-chain amino acid transport system substrate-binding protein
MKRRSVLALASTLALAAGLAPGLAPGVAWAQADRPLRMGVLNDLSSVYSDYQGIGSVIAAQMAVEDFGGRVGGRPIEVLSADHQNKPDVGATIARQWLDQDGVELILDIPNSSVALAVNQIVRERNRVFLASGAGTAALTGAQCSPNTIHWTYDTWALGNSLGRAIVGQGGRRWFFITADYAFGHDLEQRAADAVRAAGGEVVGAVRHPLGTSDFSSFLLQAQASGADVVGFANAGGDLSTSLKQASEFGLGRQQRLAGLIFNVNNVPGLGLETTRGIQLVTGYYWDLNADTRAFAERFARRHPQGNYPNDMQAGVYSAVMHYLKAVDALGQSADGRAVVDRMKATPTDDPIFGRGTIRADGRKLHPMYLLETKAPSESRGGWDFFRKVAEIPADQAWRPLAEGGCSFAS